MIGVELNQSCGQLVGQAREKGILINVASDKVVRMVPPLNLKEEESGLIVETVGSLIQEFGS